jgi:hypothetical protein
MINAVRRLDLDQAAERPPEEPGVEGNRRLTAALGVVLLVLLAIEGGTIPFLSQLEPVHVIVGLVLIPVVLLKLGTTFYRFSRYYLQTPTYRRAGPPHPVMRIDGPFVVVLTISLFASGVALAIAGHHNNTLYAIHKLSFIAWFAAMTVHVLGHLLSLPRVASRDWGAATRIAGSRARQVVVCGVVITGLALAVAVYPLLPAWSH